MIDHLDDSFLAELLRACINKKGVLLVVKEHLKISFLPEKSGFREVWKEILKYENLEKKQPSLGILKQKLLDNELALEALAEIRDIVMPDYEGLVKAFENFIKQHRFVDIYESVGDLYNQGKREEAFVKYSKESNELVGFTLSNALHESIFKDFNKRHIKRQDSSEVIDKKTPYGIDVLDYYTDGGHSKGETTLWLGDSGVGKSQLLIHNGIAAARRGRRVAHFQAEGLRQQVLDRYDAAWSGQLYKDVKLGHIDSKLLFALQKIIKKVRGEIFVETRERFGSWTMVDIRQSLIGMFKAYGDIDLVIIDYLDLIDPGNGIVYRANEERFRQQAVARMMKDLAVEFNVSLITATQASAVPPESYNDADFLLSRWNLAEDKGKLRPFDNFLTLNQTRDEKRNKIIRIFADKLREHDSGFDAFVIAQSLNRSRFYDRNRTIEEFIDDDMLELMKFPK